MTTRHRRRVREAVASLEQRRAALSGSMQRLHEVGRVLSAANEDKLRSALTAIEDVLKALDSTETNESDRLKALKMAEAMSGSASDASSGAYLLGSLLGIMGDESDEPDDMSILRVAYNALVQWITGEVAEIGTDQDDDPAEDPYAYMYGYEAVRAAMDPAQKDSWIVAREKLRAAGGFKPSPAALRESSRFVSDLIPLRESAVREDGTADIKLIQPGWGSTGYYSPEVLMAGASVFPAGTKMFWDHPTTSEEFERPERSLRDLAAELVEDATYDANGPSGPGLYSKARVFSPYRDVLNEIAQSIGVSIVAYGTAENGTVEGKSGPVITGLVAADSVDFVTFPGAGGQVVPVIEAARQRLNPSQEVITVMEVEKDPKFVEERAQRVAAEQKLIALEAADVVTSKLVESKLPAASQKRLSAQLLSSPPVKDGKLDEAAFDESIASAVSGEVEYIAALTGAGQIRGMGSTQPTGEEDVTPRIEEAFKSLGHTAAGAKIAAAGRK